MLPDYLYKINKNRFYNRVISEYYERLKEDKDFENFLNLDNKINSIDDCYKFFQTKVYNVAKVKELERTNLCRDKFCRNCKKVKQANRSENFTPELEKYKDNLYHLILTVPNCNGEDLKTTIKKMFNAYQKLMRYFSKRAKATNLNFDYGYLGSIRSLEITFKNYIYDDNNFHPHLHCAVVFEKNPVLHKDNLNVYSYSYKSKYEYDYEQQMKVKSNNNKITAFSDFEILIQKVWYLLYNNETVNYNNVNNLREGYSCKLDKFHENDYAELFKYMIKEVDENNEVLSYDVFKVLLTTLHGVRQIQGYGVFYNIKNDEDKDIFKESDKAIEKFIREYVKGERGERGYESTRSLYFDHEYKLFTKKKLFRKVLKQYDNES